MKFLSRLVGAGVLTTLGMTFLPLLVGIVVVTKCPPSKIQVSAPVGNPATAADYVHALEGQGLTRVAAAGVVGNLQQESNLDPTMPDGTGGGGLGQWGGPKNGNWYAAMVSWTSGRGLNPVSANGQLQYIAFELRTGDAHIPVTTLSALNNAASASVAAVIFQNDYEQCLGAGLPGTLGTDDAAGSCMSSHREAYATAAYDAAGGTTVPVVDPTAAGGCSATDVSAMTPGTTAHILPSGLGASRGTRRLRCRPRCGLAMRSPRNRIPSRISTTATSGRVSGRVTTARAVSPTCFSARAFTPRRRT